MSDVLEVGSIVEGEVLNIKPYGAFVSIGSHKGLIHISEISDEYVKNINDILAKGDKVKVKVISNDDGKIALSIKDLDGDFMIEKSKNVNRFYERENSSATIEVTHKCMANYGQRNPEDKKKTFDELMKDFNRQANDKIVDINRRLKNR